MKVPSTPTPKGEPRYECTCNMFVSKGVCWHVGGYKPIFRELPSERGSVVEMEAIRRSKEAMALLPSPPHAA